MDRFVGSLVVALAAPAVSAQLAITPVDAFARGGGSGFIDAVEGTLSVPFGNQDEAIETQTLTAAGRTTLVAEAGTGTSGGILDVVGRASGFARIELDIPALTPGLSSLDPLDNQTAVITATASASSEFTASDIGEFEGGFVDVSGFASAAIAFDIQEPLFAIAMGDFLGAPGVEPITRLEPGRHIFVMGINAPLSLSGDDVTSGLEIETNSTFNGQIVLSRVPGPASAMLFGLPFVGRRRR